MEQRILSTVAVAREALRRARTQGRDQHYAIVLHAWRAPGASTCSCVGAVTAGGTTLPLTRALCEALEYTPTLSDGRVFHVSVPYEQQQDSEDTPLRSVAIAACLTQRQTLAAEARLEHLEAAPIVLTCRIRPPGWPR